MGLWDDISSSSSSSSSISLPSISYPSVSLPSSYSIPSYGSIPSGEGFGSFNIDSIQTSINNALSSVIPGMQQPPPDITGQTAEIQAGAIGNLTQFQQDFNAQLTGITSGIQQQIKPFLDKITNLGGLMGDLGGLMELLSNPETIIIIVAVIAAVAIAAYLVYKFYWKKITFGESVADKYTGKGLEAAKILK